MRSNPLKAPDMPSLPEPDEIGNCPAIEYTRVSLAHKRIRGRVDAGLSQKDLAALAGVREGTILRIESGKHPASIATMKKICAAFANAKKNARR